MNAHPAAEIFPVMSRKEYTDLLNDIRDNGQREPIWTIGGQVLDGRHRLRACEELGIDPGFMEWEGDEESAIAFVISMNLKRRHLNASQLAMVAAKIANMRPGRQEVLSNLPIGRVSQTAAAETVGASVRSVARATEVLVDGSKALVEAVEQGEVSVSKAAEVAATVPKKQQMAAVKTPRTTAPKVDVVPKAEHDALVEKFNSLAENREDLASLVESEAMSADEKTVKIQQLQVELRQCKRARDEAMAKAAEMGKQIKFWKREAEKLGWKPK